VLLLLPVPHLPPALVSKEEGNRFFLKDETMAGHLY